MMGLWLGGCQTVSELQQGLRSIGLPIQSTAPDPAPSTVGEKEALARVESRLDGLTWPAPMETWSDLRATLARIGSDLQPLADSPEKTAQRLRLNELKTRIKQAAPALFARHDLMDGPPFFEIYPVDLDAPSLMDSRWPEIAKLLDRASPEQLRRFTSNYPRSATGDIHRRDLAARFISATGKEQSGSLDNLLDRLRKAEAAGFEAEEIDAPTLGFAEATSKTLLRERQIDFPASIDLDLPVRSEKMDLDDALAPYRGEAPRHVILFEVALAKVTRRVMNLKEVPSVIFVGNQYGSSVMTAGGQVVEEGHNPVSGQQTTPVNPLALEHYGIAERKAVGEPVAYRYHFSVANIRSRKNTTVNYYILDRKKRTFFKSTFDVFEEQRYSVPYNVHWLDPKRNLLKQDYDTERDIDDYEKDPVAIKLSQLADHYRANMGATARLADLGSLRRTLQRDRNMALANYKANAFDARPLNDPRFDSVVAVYTGKRGMGSGFYVAPDIVLTNWHVVENQKIVEMKRYDGRETYGRVLAKDVRLDIALVKVQDRGRPVSFYTGRTLKPGMEADVIGHPYRHLFSITRGIVSAIRKEPSISLPPGAGDKVLFVQTDAPINGGNSGGPLFHGNRVIGMNTWGYLGGDGLGFAVHYAEILEYLNEHLAGFRVDPSGRS
ncbi:S1C family serine protease [Magnetospira sp. QH-2]|uniref:S1C family serine protease n=1 Tax=Magnetospira sp. (strain QH-2) TaxID=1288970 RepID=UPI0003E81976|nr:trypsin-like peptidase domain-containing protein [Magnetospira sp. QH-2]CCQ72265.1 Putative Trypsin-like serine proteases (contain C-terminal PDZ domain) [Magnetospira sp. QH-2]